VTSAAVFVASVLRLLTEVFKAEIELVFVVTEVFRLVAVTFRVLISVV